MQLVEQAGTGRAVARIVHRRNGEVLSSEEVHNLIVNAGRDRLIKNGYGTNPSSNGLNYIALSNDPVTEDATSTTLSNEITANGLARAQGTFSHTDGTNVVTIEHTFVCAGLAQSCQKAALFHQVSGGNMNHVLGFTQRNLLVTDTITITFTITLG